MKKIIIILGAMLFAVSHHSCVNMDVYPSDFVTTEAINQLESSTLQKTVGAYSWFRASRTNAPGGGNYPRHFFQCMAFRGDDLFISGTTSDHLMQSYLYTDTGNENPARYLWSVSYGIAMLVNDNIATVAEGISQESDHLLGENYFLRAVAYFNLCNLFARPYGQAGGQTPGIVLVTEDTPFDFESVRSSLEDCYVQIEKDLKKASALMGQGYRRSTDNAWAHQAAAEGYLARLYLYWGKYQDCINQVDKLLAGRQPVEVLDNNLATYFANTRTRSETLWCLGFLDNESPGNGGIASMMYTSPDGGWGEIYTSDPMVELFQRYPEDIRWKDYHLYQLIDGNPEYNGVRLTTAVTSGTWIDRVSSDFWMANWPEQGTTLHRSHNYRYVMRDTDGKLYIIKHNDPLLSPRTDTDDYFGTNNRIEILEDNTIPAYPSYYFQMGNGARVDVTLTACTNTRQGGRKIFNRKFSGQGGNEMLASPAMLRWGELILNRAEAYAKLGGTANEANALADVNVIRTRAGLPAGALMTESNMASRGYSSVFEVVLDERRLELAYEGFRWLDLYRNNLPMDRQYAGTHQFEIIQPTAPKIPYEIPRDETDYSPGVVKNR